MRYHIIPCIQEIMPTKIRKTKPAILNGLCLYRAKDGWRWKFMSQGRVTAESGEAYTRKDKARRAFNNMVAKASFRMPYKEVFQKPEPRRRNS